LAYHITLLLLIIVYEILMIIVNPKHYERKMGAKKLPF